MSTIPASGTFTFSNVKTAFPGLSNNNLVSSYRGILPSIPANDMFLFQSVRGKSAPRPTMTLANVSGTNLSLTGTSITGTASSSQTASISIDFSKFLDGTLLSYQRGVTYSATNLPSGASINASTGVLSVSLTGATTNTITVTTRNGWSLESSISLTFNVTLAADNTIFPPKVYFTDSTLTIGSNTFEVTASGNTDTAYAWKAFDDVSNTYWQGTSSVYNSSGYYTGSQSTDIHYGEWIQIKLPYSKKFKTLTIARRADETKGAPLRFRVFGSSNGSDWTSIMTVYDDNNDKIQWAYTTSLFWSNIESGGASLYGGSFGSTESYTYFRINVEHVVGDIGSVYIQRIEFKWV